MTTDERLHAARRHRNRASQMGHWPAFNRYQAVFVRLVIQANREDWKALCTKHW